MQPNGNVIVDTICRTAKLGTTITGATENGDVTVIEAEPVEPINECPTCGQPGVFRDHVIRSLVDLPIVGHPTTSCAPSTLPVHQQALLAEDLPCWPCLRARQFKDHGPGDPLDPATTLPKSDERCRCTQVIRPGVGYEVSQVLFRLSRWENLEYAKKFDQDAKDRVVRLVEDRILAENMSMQAACQAVAPKLGVSWHTARQWTQQARRAGNIPEPVPEDLAAENARLRRENQELRDTNELLKAASAFFASELDPKRRK